MSRACERRPGSGHPALTPRSSEPAGPVDGASRTSAESCGTPAAPPAHRLRRQADRLQGSRSAACGVAAGQGRASGARVCEIAGYGEYEEGLRRLLAALERGDSTTRGRWRWLGWGLEGGEEKPLPILVCVPGGSAGRLCGGGARMPPARSSSSGGWSTMRLPSCCREAEALVMPSTFPEAFGMVAAEAAACGVLPVSAGPLGDAGGVAAAGGGAAARGRPS